MHKEDGITKLIDGEVYYKFDYANFLYEELQKKDDEIEKYKKVINEIKEKIKAYYVANDIDEIIDCITNLQEELYSTNQVVNELLDVKEENERLKELCDKYEEEHSTTFEYWKQLVKEDYKSRNEKAIECIKNKLSYETYQHLKKLYDDIDSIEEIWEDYEFDDLLNILNVGDEEC